MMRKERDYNFHILLRGIILIGFFLLIFKLLLTGSIQNYMAPKMMPFTYFAIVVLLILGVIQVWRSGSEKREEVYCNCGFDHNNTGSFVQTFFIYSMFILPILIGLWIPDTILDSSIVAKRGINYNLSSPGESYELLDNEASTYPDYNDEVEPVLKDREGLKNKLLNSTKIVVDDDYYLETLDIISNDLDLFVGKEMEITGFVYKEPNFKHNQFVAARFAISCCIADASVYGIIATADNSHLVAMDEWVRLTGIISKTNQDEFDLPSLEVMAIDRIEQPDDPYLYEVSLPY
jgi:putative membrane protein